MRRLKPDPIPEELLQRLLQAGAWAATPRNAQQWRFLVVRESRGQTALYRFFYQRAFDEVIAPHYRDSEPPPGVTHEPYLRSSQRLGTSRSNFPRGARMDRALISSRRRRPGRASGASDLPRGAEHSPRGACARPRGHPYDPPFVYEPRQRRRLVFLTASTPTRSSRSGYPMGNFGPVGGRPLEEVVFLDSWGNALPGALTEHPKCGRSGQLPRWVLIRRVGACDR